MLPDIQHQPPDKPVVFGALGDALPDLAYGDGEWLPQLKYSDDQPRDEHGRWTDDGGNIGGGKPGGTPPVTVYHGTAQEYLDSIKRDGLLLHPPTRNFEDAYYKGERGESVFVTWAKEDATRWAVRAAVRGETAAGPNAIFTPVVLTINLPTSVAALLKPDTFIPGANYIPVKIRPEWIEKSETLPLKENQVTLYLAMVIAEPAKKNVKYSDDQPRDDHGRWTDAGGGGETINEPTWSGYSDSKAQSDGIYIRTEVPAAPPNSRSVEEIGDLLDAKGPPLPYLETKDMTDEERAQVRANVARATDEMEADVRFQLDQTKNGLDWYEQDVKTAFEITAEHIPSLQDEKQQQLFSVVAGIMSTQTEPGQDWDQSARVFEKYKETGEFPIRNPENDRQWGFPSKEAGLSMLNNMIAATSEKETIDWLMQEHTGREINLAHQIYGGGGAASKLTMNEKAPGFRVFGPKIGEFIGNINGVSGITVDLWATRSFNRYFNQVNTQRVNNVPVSKGHRDAIKTMMTTVADRIGLKPQQAQAAIWFFEQQLYNHLGAKRATPGSFSEGAQKYSSRKKSIFDDQPSTPTRDEVDCMIAWMLRLRSGIPDESTEKSISKYSDDQPRDDHGRWSTIDGGGGGSGTHEDKPASRPTSPPDPAHNAPTSAAYEKVRGWEDAYRSYEVEHALIVDPDGVDLLFAKGEENAIRFTPEETASLKEKNISIFTHNHPGSRSSDVGLSLSTNDVAYAHEIGAFEVRAAANNDGNYYIRGLNNLSRDDVRGFLTNALVNDVKVFAEFSGKIESGAMTKEVANVKHWDEVWKMTIGMPEWKGRIVYGHEGPMGVKTYFESKSATPSMPKRRSRTLEELFDFSNGYVLDDDPPPYGDTSAKSLQKYSDDQPRDDHGRWTDAGGGGGSVGEPDKPSGVEMVSPNVHENLTFDQALHALDSERAHEVLNESRQVDKILAIPSEHDPAIGAWSDGAENSIIATITGRTTFDMIEASAAMKGMIADQKAVIPFHVEENGPDSMYRFTTPTGDLHAVHDALEKMGIEYHTLQPEGKGIRVWVFDQGSGIADKVVSAGVKYGQQVEVWHGRGEFLGGDTRDEGRNAYQRVIDRTLGPDQKRQWEGLYRGWRETHPVLHAYAEALTREYDESQHPRDEHGRWTSTGGGGGRPPFELTPDEKPDSSPLHTEFSRRWEPLAPSTLGIEGHFDGTPVSVDKLPESEVEHIQNVIHDMEEQIREKYHERAISRQQYNAADAALSYAGTALERSWDDTQVGLIALGKDGEPKGGATLSLRNVDETKVAHLEYLGSFQRGAGSTLLREAESEAVKHGAQRLNLYATDYAVPFYQAHGYRRIIAGENDLTKRLSTSMKAMPIAEEPIGVLAFPKANEKKELKYSDDQPRDDHGRWTDGGAGGGSVNEPDVSQGGWRGSAEQLASHGFVVADKTPRTEGLKRQTNEEYAAHVAIAKAEIERLEKDYGLKIPPGSIVMPPYDPPTDVKLEEGQHLTGATSTYEIDENKVESTLVLANDKDFSKTYATAHFGPMEVEVVGSGDRLPFQQGPAVEKIMAPSWTIAQREKGTIDDLKANVFRHELGHALGDQRHINKWIKQKFFTPGGNIKPELKSTLTARWALEHISAYASTKTHESIAEIFALATSKGYVKGTLPVHFEKMVDHMLGKRARH